MQNLYRYHVSATYGFTAPCDWVRLARALVSALGPEAPFAEEI